MGGKGGKEREAKCRKIQGWGASKGAPKASLVKVAYL